MLDAIAQTLAEQATKPVATANVNTPQATLVVPQQTAAPVLKPIISAPESLSPAFSQPTRSANTAPPAAIGGADIVNDVPVDALSIKMAQPTSKNGRVADVAGTKATEQATIAQRLVLKQHLADIVAKEKPLKEAKLRAQITAMAIALAQAGQFAQARQTAQDAMLSPEAQTDLLAQIDAIAAKQPSSKPTIAIKPSLPKPPSAHVKPLTAAIGSGRSLPSTLAFTPPTSNPSYSYVVPREQQYVSYSLSSSGQAIGGIGVVVDGSTPDFNGQSWAGTYAAGSRFNPAELWQGLSFIFPLAVPAPITSGFGWRVHPIRGDRRFHSGTDLGAPMGTPVLAAADGKVALSDWLNGYGLAIILSHNDDTRETLYGHLSQVFVKPGQWVEKGTVIGRVGSTGLSTGPHLHFELRQKTSSGWQAIDPGVQLKSALARLVKAMREG